MSRRTSSLACFKKSRDQEGYILRLYESSGQPQKCTLTLTLPFCSAQREIALDAFEIATLFFDPHAGTLKKTGLIEED